MINSQSGSRPTQRALGKFHSHRAKEKEFKMEEMLGGGAAKPKAKSAIKERASIFEKKAGGGFYTQEITSKKVEVASPHTNAIS